MSIGIVKGLWGDTTLNRRNTPPPEAFAQVKAGVERYAAKRGRVDGVYAYGTENYGYLQGLGFEPYLLDRRAWAAPQRPNKRLNIRFSWNGAIRVGYSYWWHKFKIIEAAFERHPEGVLWTDFDIMQNKANVDDLLDDLSKGQPVRASLYVQHNWTWGCGWRHKSDWNVPGTELHHEDTHAAARIVLGCGFLFFKSLDLVRECLKIQDEFPHFLDHQVVSLMFDRMHGGKWIGQDAYREQGWHTNGYYYGRQLFPPRRRSSIYFQAGDIGRRVRV